MNKRYTGLSVSLGLAGLLINTPYAFGQTQPNFIKKWVDLHGGCRSIGAMVVFEQGAASPSRPFGKKTSEWSEDNLELLRREMTSCVQHPSRSDLNQEQATLKEVEHYVSAYKQQAEARENQEAARKQAQEGSEQDARNREEAQRQAEDEREQETRRKEQAQRDAQEQQAVRVAKQQQEAKQAQAINRANSELTGFIGHIMSEAEIERAKQIGADYPSLTARADGLVEAQPHLRVCLRTSQ